MSGGFPSMLDYRWTTVKNNTEIIGEIAKTSE